MMGKTDYRIKLNCNKDVTRVREYVFQPFCYEGALYYMGNRTL